MTLAGRTLDDRWVGPTATFRVTVTLPDDSLFDLVKEMAEERIEEMTRSGPGSGAWGWY